VFDTHKNNQQDLWILPLTGTGSPEAVVDTEFDEDDGAISPDGRWFAYASTQSGSYEVYVIPFQSESQPVRVSLDGAKQPKWRGDSRELFYLNLNETLAPAAFEDGEVGKPESLFDTAIVNPEENALEWEVRADGQRFIVSVPADDSATRRIRVVVDWASRLK
jgi:eukaryotic-like serine/threonine-protein kinase